MRRILRLILSSLTIATSVSVAQTVWQRSGSSAPTTTAYAFCETPSGDFWSFNQSGLYVSRDRGVTWKGIRKVVDQYPVGDISVDSTGTLYGMAYDGLIRSTDGGLSWQVSSYTWFDMLGCVTAGPESTVIMSNFQNGEFLSTDCGEHWRFLESSPKFSNRKLVYNHGVFAVIVDSGGYSIPHFSTDRGETWLVSVEHFRSMSFLIPGTGNTFYAAVSDTLLISEDSCRTWHRLGSIPISDEREFASAATDREGRIYMGGRHIRDYAVWLAVSSDSGKTWTVSDVEGYPWQFYIQPVSDGRVFAGTYDGMLISTDHGLTWQSVAEGLTNRRINHLTSVPGGDEVYAGTDMGVYCSQDDGIHWAKVPLPDTAIRNLWVEGLAINRTGRLYVKLALSNVISTSDNGQTWKGDAWFDTATTCIVLDTSQSLLRGGAWGMLDRSTDDGITWTPTGLTVIGCVTGLYVDLHDTMYVSTSWDGLYRIAGGHGADEPIGLQRKVIRSFVKHPGGTLVTLLEVEGICRSTDAGNTWVVSNTGIPKDYTPQQMVMTQGGDILISGWSGIMISHDAGATWCSLGEGLPADSVVSVAVTPSGRVIAGTRSGLYYSSTFLEVKEPASVGLPLSSVLYQNYPNPFNPTTTIGYALPHRSRVTMTVYNTLGQQVVTLVNGEIAAGYHSVQFDASNLASGVYFYRLTAGDFVQTRKLLLAK